jgi:hypothetical protein
MSPSRPVEDGPDSHRGFVGPVGLEPTTRGLWQECAHRPSSIAKPTRDPRIHRSAFSSVMVLNERLLLILVSKGRHLTTEETVDGSDCGRRSPSTASWGPSAQLSLLPSKARIPPGRDPRTVA